MTRTRPRLNPIVFIPGFIFWGLVAAGFVTDDTTYFGVAVAVAASAFLVAIIVKVRKGDAAKQQRQRIWNEGVEARARVIDIGTHGGGLNDNPLINFELDVTVPGRPSYRVSLSQIISQLAIPRIQPGCEIAVRVDQHSPTDLVVDQALTPYGY